MFVLHEIVANSINYTKKSNCMSTSMFQSKFTKLNYNIILVIKQSSNAYDFLWCGIKKNILSIIFLTSNRTTHYICSKVTHDIYALCVHFRHCKVHFTHTFIMEMPFVERTAFTADKSALIMQRNLKLSSQI